MYEIFFVLSGVFINIENNVISTPSYEDHIFPPYI